MGNVMGNVVGIYLFLIITRENWKKFSIFVKGS
jgi:hypothetical protein